MRRALLPFHRRVFAAIACSMVALGFTQTASAADLRAWRWQRPVTLAAAAPAAEQCIALDGDLYFHSAPGLRDVRLVQAGREVPYALEESYDDRALSNQPAPAGGDRAAYTTVLRIPLALTQHDASAAPALRVWEGVGELQRHVPVERIVLEQLDDGHDAEALHATAAASMQLRLIATPGPAGSTAEGEVIEGAVDSTRPYLMTAIGANLQRSAQVEVRVLAQGARPTEVLLQMRQRSLCFQPISSEPLMLVFGNDAARPPNYTYALRYRPTATPLLSGLGVLQQNPSYRPAEVRGNLLALGRKQLALAIAVAAAAFVLTVSLLLRVRR